MPILLGGGFPWAGATFLFPKASLGCWVSAAFRFMFKDEKILVETKRNSVIAEDVATALRKPFVVVGVPAFNEEKTIAKVVLKAQEYADKVVVCDDGSTDVTAEIAECFGADVVRHERNLGWRRY
jgi:cellulose synthase/poly-beta-1,6-N-acetylglucosamine synthase-like glycosyltransferase